MVIRTLGTCSHKPDIPRRTLITKGNRNHRPAQHRYEILPKFEGRMLNKDFAY